MSRSIAGLSRAERRWFREVESAYLAIGCTKEQATDRTWGRVQRCGAQSLEGFAADVAVIEGAQ